MNHVRVRTAVTPLRRRFPGVATPLPSVDELIAMERPEEPMHCLRPATVEAAARDFAEGFPGDPSKASRLERASIDPQTLSSQVVLTDVPAGQYAVSVFHDENLNEKLDKNFMGIPKEGYGASNNPGRKMRAPTFDEACFSHQADQSLEIKLIY